tara:strand:- start:13300 stop:13443 length:144 start_codon:yes stop_codon:yes gene_type:complete
MVRDMLKKDGFNLTTYNENWIKWPIIFTIFTLGEPDLLDAIIHYLMK